MVVNQVKKGGRVISPSFFDHENSIHQLQAQPIVYRLSLDTKEPRYKGLDCSKCALIDRILTASFNRSIIGNIIKGRRLIIRSD